MYKKVILSAALLVLAGNAAGLFIGTSPGSENLGTLERGETYEVQFYITTDADESFQLTPKPSRPSLSFYEDASSRNYYELEEASMENITDWISFDQESYEINPDESFVANGATVQGTVTYFIEVPRDAEPGYHTWSMDLDQNLVGEDASGGGSLSTISLSKYNLYFRVPGEVERDLQVREVEGLRSGDSEALMQYEIENRGSVTMLLESLNREILDTNGNTLHTYLFKPYRYVEPGETITVERNWQTGDDLQAGNYRLRGTANFMTGNAFMDDTFSIEDFIEIRQSNESDGNVIPGSGDGDQGGLPLGLLAIFLVLMGSVLYAMDIDPLLILLVTGVLAASFYILLSGLPMILIAVLLIISVILVTYGWM
jgi:hypothetical protein